MSSSSLDLIPLSQATFSLKISEVEKGHQLSRDGKYKEALLIYKVEKGHQHGFKKVLKKLVKDDVTRKAIYFSEPYSGDGFTIGKTSGELEAGPGDLLNAAELAGAAEEKETHSFEIDPVQVEIVKQCCLPK